MGELAGLPVKVALGMTTVVAEARFADAVSATVSIRFSEGEPETIVAAVVGVTIAAAAVARGRSIEAPRVRLPLYVEPAFFPPTWVISLAETEMAVVGVVGLVAFESWL